MGASAQQGPISSAAQGSSVLLLFPVLLNKYVLALFSTVGIPVVKQSSVHLCVSSEQVCPLDGRSLALWVLTVTQTLFPSVVHLLSYNWERMLGRKWNGPFGALCFPVTLGTYEYICEYLQAQLAWSIFSRTLFDVDWRFRHLLGHININMLTSSDENLIGDQ